jgi:hypothetical protein
MEARRTLSRGTAAAWIGIVLLTAYFVFIGGASAGWLYAPVRLVNVLILSAVFVVWAAVAWRNPTWRPRSAIWPALVAGLGAFAVSTLFSWSQRLSVEYLAFAVLLVALYLLLVRIVAVPGLQVRVIGLAGALAALISGLYVVAVIRRWIEWWDVVGHFATPPLRPFYEGLVFTDPGGTAAITVLLASPVVAWLVIRGRSARAAAMGLAMTVAVVVVLTGARGAWLGLAVAIIVTAVISLATTSIRASMRAAALRVPRTWLMGAVAVAVVAFVVIAPSILRRATSGGGDELRFTLALSGFRMFGDAPIAGGGPGTWVARRAAFTEPDEVDFYIPHAHNVYAQTAAEFGLVGITAAVVVVLVVGRLVLRALRDAPAERRMFGLAAIFSVTYLAVHMLVDMYLNVPAILFAFVLPIALLDASAPDEDMPHVPAGFGPLARAAAPILGAASALSLVAILVIDWRALPAARIGPMADAGDWGTAAVLARAAAAADPDLPAYHFTTGLAAANLGDSETAERELRASAEEDDYAFAWLDLAALQEQRGADSEARTSLERALRLGQQQPAITLPAGLLYLRLDDRLAATNAFAEAIIGAPMLTDDPWWDEKGPDVAAAHDAAVASAIAKANPPKAVVIALLAGSPDAALASAARLDGIDRRVAELAIHAWAGDSTAKSDLERIASDDPANRQAVIWLARLAAHEGNLEAAYRYRQWVATSVVLGVDAGEDVVVTDAPIPGAQVPGPNGNFQGWYTYQRQYPWDLLVPGLPNLTLE